MSNVMQSRAAAWGGLVLVLVVMVLTFSLRTEWWTFIDQFFLFMMAFCHLAACYLTKVSFLASRKLDVFALICGILFVLALLGEYIAWQIVFP